MPIDPLNVEPKYTVADAVAAGAWLWKNKTAVTEDVGCAVRSVGIGLDVVGQKIGHDHPLVVGDGPVLGSIDEAAAVLESLSTSDDPAVVEAWDWKQIAKAFLTFLQYVLNLNQ